VEPRRLTRALIAGAGIAGLTLALALARRGVESVVFERAAKVEAFGAGLQLSPNATRALARLGLLDAIAARATAPARVRILRGRDDTELSSLDLTGATARWGSSYVTIHRADLAAALAQACAAEPIIDLRLGHELVGYGADPDKVRVAVKRGLVSLSEEGDLLVGADGLRSKVRGKLVADPADAPAFAGRIAFRATLPAQGLRADEGAPVVTLRLGKRAHLVQYALRDGATINLVAVIEAGWRGAPPVHPWDGEADRPALERAFAGWSRNARGLIAAPPVWRAWPLHGRPPLPSYASGRVALMGDAAHPMMPFLAQGAAQAIEDSETMAASLAREPDVATALAAYSSARVTRANRVQREALAQARVYHMSGPLAFARDLGMRALGPEGLMRRYDWLYGA
jgi:salicylate hydroxylase